MQGFVQGPCTGPGRGPSPDPGSVPGLGPGPGPRPNPEPSLGPAVQHENLQNENPFCPKHAHQQETLQLSATKCREKCRETNCEYVAN